MYTRYRFAADLSRNRTVLEVACGSGQGLGLLAKNAARIFGLDIDMNLLSLAQANYRGHAGIRLTNGNAHGIPYKDGSFDLVILYEALYYLKDPALFIAEAKRVLKKNGILLMCTANCEMPDFNPSPFSFHYFSVSELCSIVRSSGFNDVCAYGDCPVPARSFKSSVLSRLKKAAVRLHMIPRTMKGKELFKRIFVGPLVVMPADISGSEIDFSVPVPVPGDKQDLEHKVIFVKGVKQS